jgi:hypothetical protein
VINDPIATTMLKRMRKQPAAPRAAPADSDGEAAAGGAAAEAAAGLRGGAGCWWWEEPAHGVLCVASSEKQRVSLLPLPPSVPREQARAPAAAEAPRGRGACAPS